MFIKGQGFEFVAHLPQLLLIHISNVMLKMICRLISLNEPIAEPCSSLIRRTKKHKIRQAVTSLLCLLVLFMEAAEVNASKPSITVVSWNIQVGSDDKISGNNWPNRKIALSTILSREAPDIICVQEATLPQLQYLNRSLAIYDRLGVGRDDGITKGEHCAILYKKSRFLALKSGTFWLSDTPDTSKSTWDGIYKRICTWAHFRDRISNAEFCVFNTHFPLNPLAHEKAARLVIEKLSALCPKQSTFLAGDFNSFPDSKAWSLIKEAGYSDSEVAVGRSRVSNTYQVFGHGVMCIDAIFVPLKIRVTQHKLLEDKINDVYPSDHFGTLIEADFNQD